MVKRIIGVLLILAAVAGGIYFGGWVCFVQAIVGIIEAIKAGWVAIDIAIGLAKIFIGVPIVECIAYLVGAAGVTVFHLGCKD